MRWHVLPGANSNNMVQYMCLSPQKALQSYAPVGTNAAKCCQALLPNTWRQHLLNTHKCAHCMRALKHLYIYQDGPFWHSQLSSGTSNLSHSNLKKPVLQYVSDGNSAATRHVLLLVEFSRRNDLRVVLRVAGILYTHVYIIIIAGVLHTFM